MPSVEPLTAPVSETPAGSEDTVASPVGAPAVRKSGVNAAGPVTAALSSVRSACCSDGARRTPRTTTTAVTAAAEARPPAAIQRHRRRPGRGPGDDRCSAAVAASDTASEATASRAAAKVPGPNPPGAVAADPTATV